MGCPLRLYQQSLVAAYASSVPDIAIRELSTQPRGIKPIRPQSRYTVYQCRSIAFDFAAFWFTHPPLFLSLRARLVAPYAISVTDTVPGRTIR
eukprot:3033159-Rhodomonas_salina.5